MRLLISCPKDVGPLSKNNFLFAFQLNLNKNYKLSYIVFFLLAIYNQNFKNIIIIQSNIITNKHIIVLNLIQSNLISQLISNPTYQAPP